MLLDLSGGSCGDGEEILTSLTLPEGTRRSGYSQYAARYWVELDIDQIRLITTHR